MSSSAGLVLASYFAGAIPFSYLIVRYRLGTDVRKLGSGNAGATNVLRTAGVGAGLMTLILDVVKGAGTVVAAELLGAPPAIVAACGFAAVAGHVFPVYLLFRGGKGVATASGVFGVLSPFPTLVAIGVFVIVAVPTRYVALASVCSAASYPLALWGASRAGWVEAGPWILPAAFGISALVVYKHRENLRRLRNGTEPRLRRGTIEKGEL